MKFAIACVIGVVLSGCSSNHDFMRNAIVGNVDDNPRPLVMFPIDDDGKFFRPQFKMDCPYNYLYDDSTSTTCVIRKERISNLHSYDEHMANTKR